MGRSVLIGTIFRMDKFKKVLIIYFYGFAFGFIAGWISNAIIT